MKHWRQILEQALREGAWEFSRSSGPGGQNVNKVETKAVWRWSIEHSFLPFEELNLVLTRLRQQLTRANELVVASDRYRHREQNKSDCIGKVESIFAKAFYTPPPRKKTRPTRASQRRRLESKSHRSEVKTLRRKVGE